MLDEAARAFVDGQRVGHLATAGASGSPHVVPVCFALVDQTVYVALDEKPKRSGPRELRRVRNLLENPRVALVVDQYDEDWSRLAFVLLRLHARLIDGGAEHARGLAALRAKYVQYRAMALEARPLIAADVTRVTTWRAS